MPRIKSLTVRCFRGIRDTTLPFDGRSVVLLGENGSGKSSFVDALEFFFTGRVSHLEGAQAVSTHKHAPHIRFSRNDAMVEVEFERPAGVVCRTFRGFSSIPPDLKQHVELGRNSTFILRRKHLLDFILAQPAPRYQQLAAIIGVDDLDKVERTLMRARDDLLSEKGTLERQVQEEEAKLNELLGEEVVTDHQILAALNRKLGALKQPQLGLLDEIEARKVAIVAKTRSPKDTERAVKVQSALNVMADIQRNVSFLERHRKLWDEVEDLERDVDRVRELLFQEVLSSSRRLISEYDLDRCPVCLQTIDREALLASLNERIKHAEQIAKKASEIKARQTALASQAKTQLEQLKKLTSQLSELGVVVDRPLLDGYTAHLDGLLSALEAEPVDVRLPPFDTVAQAPEVKSFAGYLTKLNTELQAEKERLEPTDEDRLAVEVIDLLTRVMDSRQALLQLRPQCNAKSATYQEMAAIYDCLVSTKRAEVQKIYRELEDDIKRFFSLLHQDEGYRELSLEVHEGRRASTEIKMDFYDREQEDPRAFNSEGHLDSLGLCVFLAFVKRFNHGFPLVVLDDVVSSIDSGHRQHVCELLFQEFGDYQLLITTHDYVWFEELRAYQRAHGKQHLFLNLQILDWSLDGGLRLDRYRPRWERIEEKLASGDKDGAAADTRKALEWFLYEICLATETPVALRRDGKYVVSDLHGPFVKRVKKLVRDVYESNEAVFRDLEASNIFGNLLVHNNPRAANASLSEVRSFVNAVRALIDLFTCNDQCKHLVEYHRSAKVIKCQCGAINWKAR